MNIFSLSFGKDSMATLILAAEQGIPIDRVMYAEVKYNDEISGEHPIMAEWIPMAEKRLKELFGVTVEHAYCGYTYLDEFFRIRKKGNRIGEIVGFPRQFSAWCNAMKMIAIKKYYKQFDEPITEILGIASDERERWERKEAKQTDTRKCRSLLVEQGLTEADALELCKKYGLLSPLYDYEDTCRGGGCWFCPNQPLGGLYTLWRDYPDLYEKLCNLEQVSTYSFKIDVLLEDLKKKFENGYIPKRKKKARKFVQMDMFEKIDGGDEHDD